MDLAASVVVKNKNNVWINDNMVTYCHNCKTEFSFFVRKHHCRNCGNIFCYECCKQMIVIPEFITDRPDAADYWNISYYITSLKGTAERVCKQCYTRIKEKIKAHDKIVEIFNNPISIDLIKGLTESNIEVKNHYFDHLRNIQYYLPNHKYTENDKKLLIVNSKFFSRHSKYLMHFIKSINWETARSPELEFVVSIINGEKNTQCNELYCTRTCQEALSCDDCVSILYSTADHLPDVLMNYLFEIIMQTPEPVILCHLSFFINMVKNNSTNKLLQQLIFKILTRSKKLIYQTYWFLNNSRETSNLQEIMNINNFIDLFDRTMVKKMYDEYMFFVGLIKNLDDAKRYLMNEFNRIAPISLPYEPDVQLINVDIDNISVKTSYTKPVLIPFETDIVGKINLLFKRESIMNDVAVLNLMTLCDIILAETLNCNFNTVIYPIIPLSANSGMIEIVDRAETIHNISAKKKTISQYIIENNENRTVGDIMNRYMYSLVSYTLHSYFLGISDRHDANILVTEDGAIFHIDFGYILGNEAHPLSGSNIKLNAGMLDVIGGTDSTRYSTYLELCAKGVVVLRKYFNMFFILLSQNSKFKEKNLEKFILTRFQPRQNDKHVITELMTIIKNSHNAYADCIRDFLHYHTQEKTVQYGLKKAIKTAFGTIKSFTNSH